MNEATKYNLRELVNTKYNELLAERGLSDAIFSTSFKLPLPEHLGPNAAKHDYCVISVGVFEALRDAFELSLEEILNRLEENR